MKWKNLFLNNLLIFISKDFYVTNNEQRNAQVFDEEIERLERWADDKKLSIEVRLKELELEIKQTKKEAIKGFERVMMTEEDYSRFLSEIAS